MSVGMASRSLSRLRVRAIARVSGIVAGGLAALGLGGSVLLSVFGLTPLVIVSGSMEPGYPVGTVVFSQQVPADLVAPGDVVTTDRFNGPGTVTHRVVDSVAGSGGETILTLKGDANDGVDREPYTVREVGITRAAIPFVGLPQLFVQDLLGIDPLGE